MSDPNFEMPRKFTFDEFYELLKEFVHDHKVCEALAIYDAEDALGCGDLLDGSQCSDLAFESYSDFKIAGWNILANNGWPTYREVVKTSNSKHRRDLMDSGIQLWKIGRRLIRKEPKQKGWDFQDEDFDIDDKESVLRLLVKWSKKYGSPMPFTLILRHNSGDSILIALAKARRR